MDRGLVQVRLHLAELAGVTNAWEQHVLLEISEAYGDPVRLQEIHQALLLMWQRDLMPEEMSSRVWLYFQGVCGL